MRRTRAIGHQVVVEADIIAGTVRSGEIGYHTGLPILGRWLASVDGIHAGELVVSVDPADGPGVESIHVMDDLRRRGIAGGLLDTAEAALGHRLPPLGDVSADGRAFFASRG